jgi:hypothetical protein
MANATQINRKRGDTKRITFTVQTKVGAAVDITNWTLFSMSVDSLHNPVDTSSQITVQSGIVLDGPNGRLYFPVVGTIEPGNYYYDMQGLDENGEKDTLVQGKYIVTQDINKS